MRSLRCSNVGATHSCHPTGGFHRCICSRSSTPHQPQPLGAGIRRSDPSVDIATPSPDHILPATTDITPRPDRPAETSPHDGRVDASACPLSGRSPTAAISKNRPIRGLAGNPDRRSLGGKRSSRRRADVTGSSSTAPTTVSCMKLRASTLAKIRVIGIADGYPRTVTLTQDVPASPLLRPPACSTCSRGAPGCVGAEVGMFQAVSEALGCAGADVEQVTEAFGVAVGGEGFVE